MIAVFCSGCFEEVDCDSHDDHDQHVCQECMVLFERLLGVFGVVRD